MKTLHLSVLAISLGLVLGSVAIAIIAHASVRSTLRLQEIRSLYGSR